MTDLLYQNTLQRDVEQNIPAQLHFKREANEDVVIGREKWRVTTLSSASSYGSGVNANGGKQNLIKFRLVSDTFLDMQTLRLRGNASAGGTGANVTTAANIFLGTAAPAYLLPEDGVDSTFKNVKTIVNSMAFEEIDNYHLLYPNMLTVASCPQQYYDKELSGQGHWKYSRKQPVMYDTTTIANATDAATASALANSSRKNQFANDAFAAQQWANGFNFTVPLHIGLGRTGTFLPPRVPVDIEITLEDVNKCFKNVGGVTDQYYELKDLAILIDRVSVHPKYMEKYNEVIASKGLALECDVYACVQNTVSATTSLSVNINRGVSRLRSIYSVMSNIASNGTTANNLSNYLVNNFSSCKFTINGRAFPSSDGMVGTSEAYDCLMQSLGMLNDHGATTLLDYNMYNGAEYGWRGGASDPSLFIIGIDFQKTSSRTSGTDTAVTGGIIKVDMAFSANATASALYSFLHFDRGLLIKADGVTLSE